MGQGKKIAYSPLPLLLALLSLLFWAMKEVLTQVGIAVHLSLQNNDVSKDRIMAKRRRIDTTLWSQCKGWVKCVFDLIHFCYFQFYFKFNSYDKWTCFTNTFYNFVMIHFHSNCCKFPVLCSSWNLVSEYKFS